MTNNQISGTGLGVYGGIEGHDGKRALPEALAISIIFALGVLLTVISYVAIGMTAPREGWFYQLFFERSWIQYANTLFFWLAVISLLSRRLHYQHEVKACDAMTSELQKKEYHDMNWQNAFILEERLHTPEFGNHRRSLVFSRVARALTRLMKTKSTGEMREYMRIRSEIDKEELESSYAGIKYLTWLIPTLGFVGTVLGISAGISSCGSIVQQIGSDQAPDISFAMQALGTAFDTTFLALVYSAIVVFLTSYQCKQEEQILERIDHLCIDDVGGKFEDHSILNDNLIERLGRLEDLMIRNLHGDAGSLRESLAQIPGQITKTITSALEKMQQQHADALAEVCETVRRAGQDHAQLVTLCLDRIEKNLANSLDKGNRDLLDALRKLNERLEAGSAAGKRPGGGVRGKKPKAGPAPEKSGDRIPEDDLPTETFHR